MIEVKELVKEFITYEKQPGLIGMFKSFFNAKKKVKVAVNKINFKIEKGEIVGYIGPNGAGKSTTIKMLTGILSPTSGTVSVGGKDPQKNRRDVTYNIGVVFGQRTQLWWDLPLIESYTILKEIYDVSDEDYKERMTFFNDILGINDFIKSPVRTLSLGQRMRADIAASLLHNPKVLFLDEPTIGLDIVAKQKMREAIKLINEKYKTTVILTTHDLNDIEQLCNRIMIIDKGNVIYDGSLHEIKDRFGYMKSVEFEINDDIYEKYDLNDLFSLNKSDFLVSYKENKISVRFNKKLITVKKIAEYVMKHYEVIDMTVNETDIEDIIKNIYEKGNVEL